MSKFTNIKIALKILNFIDSYIFYKRKRKVKLLNTFLNERILTEDTGPR
jgi:hypothetical protein